MPGFPATRRRADWRAWTGRSRLTCMLSSSFWEETDILRGIDPAVSRANLRGILEKAADDDLPVLLVGHEVISNYGPDYKRDFEAIYRDLSLEFGTLFHERFFDGLEDGLDRHEAAQKYLQDDLLHPNADGVGVIVATMGPLVLELVRLARERSMK